MTKDTIRVLHFSTHNEQCGIGRYQEMFLECMAHNDGIHNEFFPISPNKSRMMSRTQFNKVLEQLKDSLENFDILHAQHEFSFYKDDELNRIIELANSMGKKTIVTVHTSPNVVDTTIKLGGFGPRSWLYYLRKLKRRRWLIRSMISPIKLADMVILHNQVTTDALVKLGVSADKIKKITIPVPEVNHDYRSSVIKNNLDLKKGDIVLSTVGFLHRFKGLKEAIKSLVYLPDNYKLAIVGGLHPHTDDIKIYDEIADLIRNLELKDRVYITGFIKEDDIMNAMIRETDICVFPYDREYYSNVSSAALNNSFANYVPAVVYPTGSFIELNSETECMTITPTFSYYELARSVKKLDIESAKKASIKFAKDNSYENISRELRGIYEDLLK
jgi:glycosyltransferase involved in cell wall biosynthesis